METPGRVLWFNHDGLSSIGVSVEYVGGEYCLEHRNLPQMIVAVLDRSVQASVVVAPLFIHEVFPKLTVRHLLNGEGQVLLMPVPVSQMLTVALYVLKQKLRRRRRYSLVLMLEPLFRCNLACAGCGKIQYPAHILKKDAGDALGRELLPRALARLLGRASEIEVYLREGPGPRLLEALREGEIDLALVVAEAADGARDVDVEPWLQSDIQLLVPGKRGVAGRRAVRLEALADRRLVVLQQGSGFRRHLQAAFDARGSATVFVLALVASGSIFRHFA